MANRTRVARNYGDEGLDEENEAENTEDSGEEDRDDNRNTPNDHCNHESRRKVPTVLCIRIVNSVRKRYYGTDKD